MQMRKKITNVALLPLKLIVRLLILLTLLVLEMIRLTCRAAQGMSSLMMTLLNAVLIAGSLITYVMDHSISILMTFAIIIAVEAVFNLAAGFINASIDIATDLLKARLFRPLSIVSYESTVTE